MDFLHGRATIPARSLPQGDPVLHRLLAAPAFLLAAIPAFFLWSWLGRPVPIVDAPGGRLDCLSYTPYDGSGSPLAAASYKVAPESIRADLKALHPTRSASGRIRPSRRRTRSCASRRSSA